MNDNDFQLLERYLDGQLSEKDTPRLRQLLFESSEARSTLRTLATLDLGLHDFAASQNQSSETKTIPPGRTTSSLFGGSLAKTLLTLASLAMVGLGTALWFQLGNASDAPDANRNVAKVIGIGGAVAFTGNGGSVSTDLDVGTPLTGGTIEGTNTTSWVEFEFLDGSRVTVAGDSRLTFSDLGQKVLHLKEGNVASSVKPQKPESPMLVYTGNAMLEVLGTEFKVKSEIDATSLDVTEGKVRFVRLSDGQAVEVPANERVQSSEGFELATQPIPARTSHWESDLNHPDGTKGRWLPASDSLPPRLKPIFYRHKNADGNAYLLKVVGMGVLGSDNERVLLHADSTVRVRGYAKVGQKAVFGLVVRDPNGEFGGYYDSSQPAVYWKSLQTDSKKRSGELHSFEFTIDAADLNLGQDLQRTDQQFAASPVGLVVDAFFCSAPPEFESAEGTTEDSDLVITKVDIFRPDAD